MKLINLIILLAAVLLLVACGEEPERTRKEVVAPEPVDVQATEQINDKLLRSMQVLSDSQTVEEEGASKQGLEQLSEADRQAIIDLTIEQSADKVEQDADEVLKDLQNSVSN